MHHLPFRQAYRSSSLRFSGNWYFEAILLYVTVPLSRILEPMCYCQNHSVLPRVIIPLNALFDVMGLESFIFILDVTFLASPWTAYVVNYQSRLSCFPSYAWKTEFCGFGGWSVLRLMRSFIKKEGMVYYEIIHSICITNFIPKIVIYGRYGYYIRWFNTRLRCARHLASQQGATMAFITFLAFPLNGFCFLPFNHSVVCIDSVFYI